MVNVLLNSRKPSVPLFRYLNLVLDLPNLPCLIDADGLVISLAPVTNSDLTKMSEETQSVWVEVSSRESMSVCKEITALHKKKPVSARELIEALHRDADLARRRTKRNTLNPLHRYLNLVLDLPNLPCLIDADGLVISLAPVTNSDLTKMSEETHSCA
ncbi:hypothetical protein OSTOST_08221 [Ostertagia ostertagi]